MLIKINKTVKTFVALFATFAILGFGTALMADPLDMTRSPLGMVITPDVQTQQTGSGVVILAPQSVENQIAESVARNQNTRETMEALITEVEPFLYVRADGMIVVDPSLKKQGLSPQALQFVAYSVANTNAAVKQGLVRVGTDGELYPTPQAGLRPAYSSQQGITYYWWGSRTAISHDNIHKIAVIADGAGKYAAVAAALAVYLKFPPAAFIAILAAAVIDAGGWTLEHVFDRQGRGVYIYQTYFPKVAWITSQ